MRTLVFAGACLFAASAQAQTSTLTFDQAAYVTCREAQAMRPDARKTLAVFLAERADMVS